MTDAKSLLTKARELLKEEHEAHHSQCCFDPEDRCHIGQFLIDSERFV